jgi:hypothetical protein
MTPARPLVPLRWPGTGTLSAAHAAIRSRIPIEIELPLEVHYALFKHLYPRRRPTGSEDIDASGGAELLETIATVAGLEDLKNLATAVRRGQYRVRLTSPDPRLRLLPLQDERVS